AVLRLVDREADVARGELEEHPGGRAEVDRVEVLAVDDRRRPGADRGDLLPERVQLRVVGDAPRDVVDGPGPGDAGLVGRLVPRELAVALGAGGDPAAVLVALHPERVEERVGRRDVL